MISKPTWPSRFCCCCSHQQSRDNRGSQ